MGRKEAAQEGAEFRILSAVERARTSKVFLPLAPQASASASFATTAIERAGLARSQSNADE